MYLRPSCTSWCARQTKSRLFMWLNCKKEEKTSVAGKSYCNFRSKSHYLRCDPGAKKPTSSSWTDCPCFYIFWITPHEITKWSFMWNFTIPFNHPNLPNRGKKRSKYQNFICQHNALNHRNNRKDHILAS